MASNPADTVLVQPKPSIDKARIVPAAAIPKNPDGISRWSAPSFSFATLASAAGFVAAIAGSVAYLDPTGTAAAVAQGGSALAQQAGAMETGTIGGLVAGIAGIVGTVSGVVAAIGRLNGGRAPSPIK